MYCLTRSHQRSPGGYGRWPRTAEPELVSRGDGGLRWRQHVGPLVAGTVDGLRAFTAEVGLPGGFYVDAYTKRNAILRCECEKVAPAEGEPTGDALRGVVEALQACS